jgi:hypothetical protein
MTARVDLELGPTWSPKPDIRWMSPSRDAQYGGCWRFFSGGLPVLHRAPKRWDVSKGCRAIHSVQPRAGGISAAGRAAQWNSANERPVLPNGHFGQHLITTHPCEEFSSSSSPARQ